MNKNFSKIIPEKIPIITFDKYEYALSFYKGDSKKKLNAFLIAIDEEVFQQLDFCEGKVFVEDMNAKSTLVEDMELIPQIDLTLLNIIYGIFLKYAEEDGYIKIPKKIEIFLPGLLRGMERKTNLSDEQFKAFAERMKLTGSIIGYLKRNGKDTFWKVIEEWQYDRQTKTVTITSLYMSNLIKDIISQARRKDKYGRLIKKKDGNYSYNPSHSYLLPISILNEKNKLAVECLINIIRTLEKGGLKGSRTVNISASTIIKRSPAFQNKLDKKLNKMKHKHRQRLIDTTLKKVWELFDKYIASAEKYAGISYEKNQVVRLNELDKTVWHFSMKDKNATR